MNILVHHNLDCGTSVLAVIEAAGHRPIVRTPKGVRLCRPSEAVLDLLAHLPPGPPARKTVGSSWMRNGGGSADGVADPPTILGLEHRLNVIGGKPRAAGRALTVSENRVRGHASHSGPFG